MQTSLLNTLQAENYLDLSKDFLERDRWAVAKVPFIKTGERAVRYRIQDLERYIESCSWRSTSDLRGH